MQRRWLHSNADWVLLEPVDRDFRPTPPARMSHTVLLTNLAIAFQPVIRYDLTATRWTALPRTVRAAIRCPPSGYKDVVTMS
jgi:phenylacetate-coenzyme A ligase PaaK-like adenylate-forming protein